MEHHHRRGDSASQSSRRGLGTRKGRSRRPGLEALESRELLSVNEYSLLPAENNNTNSEPTAIVAGPDGNLWFTDLGTSEVGKVTPAGQITVYSSGLTPNSSPEGITAGPDGNLWFVETAAGKIGRINPSTGQITEFTQGLSSGAEPVDITSGPDGNLWFTEFGTDKIGKINPSTGAITEYSSGISAGAQPSDITVGPDGNLWFTEQGRAAIGRINPTTGVVTQYSQGITANSLPTGIAAGSDGNIWFTEHNDHKIGMLNPTTGAVTEYPISVTGPSGYTLVDITTGSDGNLWLTAPVANGGAIVSFNPTTHAVTAYDTTPDAAPYGIAYGPDGNIWFTELTYTFVSGGQTEGGGAVGDVTLATHLTLSVSVPPSSVKPVPPFGLTVSVGDAGALDTNFNGAVTITLANNPGGSTLGGTTTATAVDGVATFSGLTLNNVGNGYTLQASSNALTPTTTDPINVITDSDADPDEPHADPDEPHADPDEPHADPDEPHADPDEPHADPDEPHADPDEPHVDPDAPADPAGHRRADQPGLSEAQQEGQADRQAGRRRRIDVQHGDEPGDDRQCGRLPGGMGVHEEGQEEGPDGPAPDDRAVGDRRSHEHRRHAGDGGPEDEVRQGGPGHRSFPRVRSWGPPAGPWAASPSSRSRRRPAASRRPDEDPPRRRTAAARPSAGGGDATSSLRPPIGRRPDRTERPRGPAGGMRRGRRSGPGRGSDAFGRPGTTAPPRGSPETARSRMALPPGRVHDVSRSSMNRVVNCRIDKMIRLENRSY